MTKVLFISQWYPHGYDSMAGLFVQKHAEAASRFCDVAVLYVHADRNITRFEIVTSKDRGIREILVYFPCSGDGMLKQIKKQLYFIKAYQMGYKLLRKKWGSPDIIQANVFTRTALVANYFRLRYRIPYAVIEHWTRYFRETTFRNRLHKALSKYAARNASAVLPVTYHLQKSMEKHGMHNKNYQIINNVVDDLFFERLVQPVTTKIRIINVTCYNDDQKNLKGLLRTTALLYQKRQDFELYMVGTGDDYNAIEQYAKELGIEGKAVFFTGLLIGSELVEAYQKSRFSVLFSNYENIPVVISESMACGLPVISTNVGGISEHINQSNGILIDTKDEKALYQAINHMLDHYMEYDRVALMETARQKYSFNSVGEKLSSIYSTILKS